MLEPIILELDSAGPPEGWPDAVSAAAGNMPLVVTRDWDPVGGWSLICAPTAPRQGEGDVSESGAVDGPSGTGRSRERRRRLSGSGLRWCGPLAHRTGGLLWSTRWWRR